MIEGKLAMFYLTAKVFVYNVLFHVDIDKETQNLKDKEKFHKTI